MEIIVDENYALVLDAALHFYRKIFHGFTMQEYSGLKGCC